MNALTFIFWLSALYSGYVTVVASGSVWGYIPLGIWAVWSIVIINKS